MKQRFAHYAWAVLGVNVLVILWGAVVRATGSGAGCGEHWPLCNGAVIPQAPQIQTIIEFGHRLTSGVAFLMAAGLAVYARLVFPKDHFVRRTAALALFFELTEAIIGAGLVLLGHVAANASVYRGYSLGLHLTNTFLLLACLALTAWFGDGTQAVLATRPQYRGWIAASILGILLTGVTGAITALGDTLFASSTLAEGILQDLSPAAHPFVRLRVWHPILACLVGACVAGLALVVLQSGRHGAMTRKLGISLITITFVQLSLGLMNLVLMAPVPMQILHLLIADLLWIVFVLFSSELLLRGDRALTEAGESHAEPGTALA